MAEGSYPFCEQDDSQSLSSMKQKAEPLELSREESQGEAQAPCSRHWKKFKNSEYAGTETQPGSEPCTLTLSKCLHLGIQLKPLAWQGMVRLGVTAPRASKDSKFRPCRREVDFPNFSPFMLYPNLFWTNGTFILK